MSFYININRNLFIFKYTFTFRKLSQSFFPFPSAKCFQLSNIPHSRLTTLQNANEQIYDALVTDKLRVSYGHIWNTHKYLIYTIDDSGNVRAFKNTDSIPYLKFNSSDFYARIEIGKTYTFRVVGYRLPYFSKYKNIVGISSHEE